MEMVPTICISHLTKDEIRAYVIADNKLAENASWNKEILKSNINYSFCDKCGSILIKDKEGNIFYTLKSNPNPILPYSPNA